MDKPGTPPAQWTLSTMRSIAAEPTLSEAALRFARLGIPVFPCVPGAKQPLTPNGFHDATASAAIVQAWWQRTPDANIGLPTGLDTGIHVVDIDVHPGGSGFAAFDRARAEGLGDGWGWAVRTPSGGIHAYYLVGDSLEQRSWQVPSAHIDFRGDGGYVIAPPSRITVDGVTKTYDVIAVTTRVLKTVDATRLRAFLEPPRRTFMAPRSGLLATGCRPEALARVVARAPEGGRNHALFWASCRMAENGQSRTQTLSHLVPAAQHAGLPDREIESTIASAFRIVSRLGSGDRPAAITESRAAQL